MSSSIAASLGLTRPRKRTTPILESGEFVAPPPTSFASPLVIGNVGQYWSSSDPTQRRKDPDEESLFELEEYFVDGIRAVGTPKSIQGPTVDDGGDESEEDYPTIRYVGGKTAPNTPKPATSSQMAPERSVTPKASRLMRVQTVRARAGGRKEKDIGSSPLSLPAASVVTPDLGALVSEAMGRNASTATVDRPFIGRSISYHPPTVGAPETLVPAPTITTVTPLAAPVPPSASSLGVFIPLTMPLKVPHRPASDPPPPGLPSKPTIRAVQHPRAAAISPLASPSSNPSPLSTPGREQPPTLAPQLEAAASAYSQFATAPVTVPNLSLPSPLSTPGREVPPTQPPTLPATSAQAAQLHATMVAAAVAAATAQIERTQSAASNQTSSTSSTATAVPQALQAGSAITRKPVPALFALSNAATEPHHAVHLAPSSIPVPIRQLTLPEMVVTEAEQLGAPSIVPGYSSSSPASGGSNPLLVGSDGLHRNVLATGPASIPLSRYGTRGASHVQPQPVLFTPPQQSRSTRALEPPSSSPVVTPHPPSLRAISSTTTSPKLVSSNELTSESLSLNRSNSSLALLAPLTKFPDPAFPRRPLVLSEYLSRFRASIANPTSPDSLWNDGDHKDGQPNEDERTRQRRKTLGTMFRTGKGAAIKWVGKDGLLKEDESWTIQKWGLLFTVATLFGYALAGMICAFSTYLHSWQGADVAVVVETGLFTALTIAAFFLLLTSLLGLSGTLLNSRPLLAIYAVLLWPCLAVLLVVAYVSYRRATLNLEGKLDQLWSQALSAAARKVVQDEFRCCGYYNSYRKSPILCAFPKNSSETDFALSSTWETDDATFTPTCFPRSNLPGCKGALLRFESVLLRQMYRVTLGIVPLHLVNITVALLCANHVDRQFGKGLMPRQYRLK
ncbi:uncharacterized protein JCM15063_004620 [Sporobolomyces koalae]|uniref:uncharacterized protein n=1 Tax=Sporobolomyces koalae TaxID=500713 RepID=UPI00316D0037